MENNQEEDTTTLVLDNGNNNNESIELSKDSTPVESNSSSITISLSNEQQDTESNVNNNNNNVKVVEETAKPTQPVVSSVVLHHGAKLIQVAGNEEPYHYIPVPLSFESLNLEDAFIMQSDAYMFVWNSDQVHSQKRAKAIQMAQKLKVEIGCQRAVIPLEYGEEHLTFLYCLNVPKGEKLKVTKEKSEILLDEEGEFLEPEIFLYRVGKVDGKLNVIPIEEEVITQEMFVSESCFILDCEHEIFVWQGEKSSKSEREVSVTLAKRFLTMFERPSNTAITPVFDGAEGVLFKSKFKVWKDKEITQQSYLSLGGKKKETPTFEVSEMYNEKEIPQINLGSDEHKGKLLVWSCTPTGKWRKVEEDDFGIFYSNRSYVCHFIYRPEQKNSIKSVIFYWEGCYANNRNYIAYKFGLYKEIQKKMESLQSDDPVEYRISQNKEPLEFIHLFGSETIVLNEELSTAKPMMFQIRGEEGNCRGTQVAEISASRLCSLDAFTVILPGKCILVWFGKASNEAERTLASELYTFLPAEFESGVKEIEEGEEPESFWKIIGGKAAYPDVFEKKPAVQKLFICTESSGIFKAEQVKPFSQVDLNSEENFIFDTYSQIYVWKGKKTSESKFKSTLSLAKQYKSGLNREGEDQENDIVIVNEGEEDPLFKSFFISWKEVSQKVFVDPLEVKRQKELELQKQLKLQQQQEKAAEELKADVKPDVVEEKVEEKVESPSPVKVEEVVEKVEEQPVSPPVKEEVVEEKVEEKGESKVEEEEQDQTVPVLSEDIVKSDQVEEKEVEQVIESPKVQDEKIESPKIIETLVHTEEEEEADENDGEKKIYTNYDKNSITMNSHGDLLFAYQPFIPTNNVTGSPKQNRKGKKKKPKHRSLSQSNTPSLNSNPISKSMELPINSSNGFESLSSSPSSSLNISSSSSTTTSTTTTTTTTTTNQNQHSPHFKRRNNKHNRTGSHGSPYKRS